MAHTLKHLRSGLLSSSSRLMATVVAVNAALALVLGGLYGQWSLAALGVAVACAPAVAGALMASDMLRSALAFTLSLTLLVALQIQLSTGSELWHFNVFVSLSVLLVYKDWRPLAAMAGLFTAHHIAFDRLLQAGFGTHFLQNADLPETLVHVGFVLAQTLVLSLVAISQKRSARESRELEVLVNTMGRDGPIRLNLGVMQAQTAAGQRLQHVQQRMAAAMAEVQIVGYRIEAAAQLVANGSGALKQRTRDAATGLQDSAMCLQQIGVIVEHSTQAASEARSMSTTAAAMAERGNRLVADVVTTMRDIENSSHRINEIIAVIDSIAFQTNILALNAAIEAARAGEQGRGFAVVAGEVRQLAQRSAAAAREIKDLITESTGTVHSGAQMVAGAGEAMNQLVESVKRVGELFQAVTSDTTEQMQGLRTVSQSLTELSDSTQGNVSVADEASQAATDMHAQVARLAEVLSAFKLSSALTGASQAAMQAAPAAGPPAAAGPPTATPAAGPAAAAAPAPTTKASAPARKPAAAGATAAPAPASIEYF